MKYFAYFKNDRINSHWIKEDDNNDHPSYIPKDEIKEITLEQHENAHQLILDGGTVKYDPIKRAASLARKLKREKNDLSKQKLKQLSNAELSSMNAYQLVKVVKSLLDIVVDRDELTDQPF